MTVRLLNKFEIDRRKAEEKRQQIEEGTKIAERVDALRETLASEQKAYDDYAALALANIQERVGQLKEESDALEGVIARRKSELEALMAPADAAWVAYVKAEKAHIEAQIAENAREAGRLAHKIANADLTASETALINEQLRKTLAEYERKRDQAKAHEREAIRELDKARNKAQSILSQAELKMAEAQQETDRLSVLKDNLALKESELNQLSNELTAREFKVLSKELQLFSPVQKV